MRMRPAAALLLACLVVGLAAVCGSAPRHAPPVDAKAASWSAGLRSWSHGMRGALNGMSKLFASPTAVQAIEDANRRVGAQLVGYEATLSSCSSRLARLGPAPSGYGPSLRFARQACVSLRRGAALVKRAVKQFQAGLGSDLFSQSTQPLSVGQDDLQLATDELAVPSG